MVDSNTGNGGTNIGNGPHKHSMLPQSSPGDGVMYDPEMVNHVNLTDPDELEAHLQILDVRERLRSKRRRAIRLFSVASLLAVAALLVSVGVMSSKSTSAGGGATDDSSGGGTMASSGGTLPPPPADLTSRCSVSSLNTPHGVTICEAACEVADCCDVPQDFAMSCADDGNRVACAQYQRYCSVLNNIIPDNPPPSMETDEGGVESQTPGSDGSAEELKVAIDNACLELDPSMMAASPCMSLCQAGFCCFDEASSDCPANCQAYMNCAEAYSAKLGGAGGDGTADSGSSAVPTGPPANSTASKKEELEQLCGTELETITPPGGESCESLCSVSYCCFNHFCVAPPDIDCLEYSACYALYADVDETTGQDGNEPDLGDDVHSACAGLLNINDAAADQACQSACAPGACCFEPNLTCGGVDCSMYADCIVLHPSFISVSREEVTDACTNHNDASSSAAAGQAPSLCEQVCTLHVMQCCFHSGGDCDDAVLLGDNSVYCDVYQACEVLGTDPSKLRPSHKAELDAACTGGAPTRSHCIQLCSSATCCYSTTTEEACANVDSTITCSDYKACDVLYG
jgi:hypothetical protein